MSTESGQKFGLFGATKPSDGKAEEPKVVSTLFGGGAGMTKNLFGGSMASGSGLFGAKPPTGGSLFGSTPIAPGGSLFSNASQGSSLFGFAGSSTTAAAAKKDDEGESDDDAEQEGEKSPPIYADSTTKIEFKGAGAQMIQPSPYTKLFEVSVRLPCFGYRPLTLCLCF